MGQRPANVKPPAYLAKSPPVPTPKPGHAAPEPTGLSPTRYGDWVSKGIAIDF